MVALLQSCGTGLVWFSVLTPRFEAIRGLFWNRYRNFEPLRHLSRHPPSPNFRTTPAGGWSAHDIRFNVLDNHIHKLSSVELDFEPGILRSRSPDLTTRPPSPRCGIGGPLV
ncbi:hypothetical protein AVEN_237798-1 [Araneus ventricosus]|uniref:Uncharacterized protein n=1 Tax=Araneus ventricosus TaxID=182803 RepID=A0A4Y2QCJ3_ARAVE|nr:hypothetical protein AVEN_237798-1 [Araneus ventricosus]